MAGGGLICSYVLYRPCQQQKWYETTCS